MSDLIGGTKSFHSEHDAARFLNLSRKTLQRWRLVGEGPSFQKFGKAIRYSTDDLNTFVQSTKRASTSQVGGHHED